MIKATRVRPAGAWKGPAADIITLDHDERHRRRVAMTADGGLAFVLDLAKATALRHGDGLLLEDGRIVEVRAKDEPLVEITTPNPRRLLRLAWHLGNRHLPVQIEVGRLLIRPDHVIEEMVRNLGGGVSPVEEPFDPEGGAYGGHGDHGGAHASGAHDHQAHDHEAHDHQAHDHAGHDHDHPHSHAETHATSHSAHGHSHSHSESHSETHSHSGAGGGGHDHHDHSDHAHDHHHPHDPRGRTGR